MKTIILKVADSVSEQDAIAAVAAAGLKVEERLPVAFYMGEDGADPIYQVRDWFTQRGYSFGEDLYIIAEAAQGAGCAIIDEIWMKPANRDLMREQLGALLDEFSEDRISVAGFIARNAHDPLLLVDGVSVPCDLKLLRDARYAEAVEIGSAVDAANQRTVSVIADIEKGVIRAELGSLDM